MAIEMQTRFLGTNQLVANLGALPEEVRPALYTKMRELIAQLTAMVRANLSGLVLKPGTPPRLLNSIRSQTVEFPESVRGRVFSEGVPYARIQEYGGKTAPHEIFPVRARFLAFPVPGQPLAIGKSAAQEMVFTKHVSHPGSLIPERSYARRALAQMRPQIIAELKGALAGPLNRIAAE